MLSHCMCPGFQCFPPKAFDCMGDKNCPLGPNTKRALTAQRPFLVKKQQNISFQFGAFLCICCP